MQILQGAARLVNDGFSIALHDGQRRADGGDASYKVSSPVVEFSAVQGGFGGLELVFDGGMSAAEKERRGIRHPQRGPGIQYGRLAATPATEYRGACASVLQRYPVSFDETLGSLDIVGSRGMQKGFNLQTVVFVPLAGSSV